MSYSVKLVSRPMCSPVVSSAGCCQEKAYQRGERRPESLLQRAFSTKNPHFVHAWASFDCKAVSRSFPYGFHLPSFQFNVDMRSAKRGGKDTVRNHLKGQPSAQRPQPTTRVSAHLSRLNLKVRRAKSEKVSVLPTLCEGLVGHYRRGQAKAEHRP